MIDTETRFLLEDMLENAHLAQSFVQDADAEAIAANRGMLYSAAFAVGIVGEAASKIAPAARASMPGIPWRKAIDMRNKLVHGYRDLAAAIVFKTVRDDFPPLIAELERLLGRKAKS